MNRNMPRRRVLKTLAGVGVTVVAWPDALSQVGTSPSKPPRHWPVWENFRQQFISEGGRVIDRSSARSQTFSEGQGYALFFALVADDRTTFEKVLRWTEDNLCGGDLTARLPAWLWGQRNDDTWGVIDSNSASDADLWIAYALGEAGRLWNERRYRALSSLISARILREETAHLPGLGPSLLPGAHGFVVTPTRWRLNPSYMPMQLMGWFAAHEPQPIWQQLAESALKIITGASPRGLAPDWTLYDAQQGFLTDLQGDEKGQGGYNAIRVYLWAGMLHPAAPERPVLLTTLTPMAHYVRDNGQPPESIDIQTGHSDRPGPSGFSAALLPFLDAIRDKSTLQLQLDRIEARPLRPEAYYEQALGLFGGGWWEGRYRFAANGRLQPRWTSP
jgi:endo-1,4-beta-D-glucanase Y